MRITPIVNAEIIGRYRKTANTITDVFTNKVLVKSNNKARIILLFNELNTKGLMNAKIIDNNAKNKTHDKLLYVIA